MAGNVIVPALLELEALGFDVSIDRSAGREEVKAVRGEETFVAEDPVAVLGLIKLVELRGWDWQAGDEVDHVLRRYGLD